MRKNLHFNMLTFNELQRRHCNRSEGSPSILRTHPHIIKRCNLFKFFLYRCSYLQSINKFMNAFFGDG